jgi:hypothetical protein
MSSISGFARESDGGREVQTPRRAADATQAAYHVTTSGFLSNNDGFAEQIKMRHGVDFLAAVFYCLEISIACR